MKLLTCIHTYCFILNAEGAGGGQTILKSKGAINTKLTVDDFKNMYFNQKMTLKHYMTKVLLLYL